MASSKPGKKPPKGSGTSVPSKAETDAITAASPSSSGATSSSSGSKGGGSRGGGSKDAPAGASVDVGAIARALSAGFLILVFGGLLQPLANRFLPGPIALFWLIIVAVVAFAVAGVRAGTSAPNPPLYGAGTAVGSYVLVVPLLFVQATFDPLTAVYTVVAAAVIGALAGLIGARSRTRKG